MGSGDSSRVSVYPDVVNTIRSDPETDSFLPLFKLFYDFFIYGLAAS